MDIQDKLADMQAALDTANAVSAHVDNSLLLLISGMVVMFMAAGFCLLETGLVRQKNAATIATKNAAIYALAGIAYYLLGYNLMFVGVDGGWIGSLGAFAPGPDAADKPYSPYAFWFFQMAFVATAASVVSGTLAERIRLWPFLTFSVILCAVIYPVTGSWVWGGGWLGKMGFADFAGSTLVHSVGGWAALAGLIVLGPRLGKYDKKGRVHPMPGSNLPLTALGTFILWFGWFGFNGGSQLAAGSVEDINAVGKIIANTNLAGSAGFVAAMMLTQIRYKKVDLTLALNGAIGGLVSITAGPLDASPWQALIIGAIGGMFVVMAVPLLDRLQLDDVVGAIPAHLVCGIWGTLAVAWTSPGDNFLHTLGIQALGVVSIGSTVFVASFIVWQLLARLWGIRASEKEEYEGLDQGELGLEAYPEFGP